jgi:hypothetical protein
VNSRRTALAERIKGSPFERWGGAREVLFEELQVSALNLDDLLGSRGAERLADIQSPCGGIHLRRLRIDTL